MTELGLQESKIPPPKEALVRRVKSRTVVTTGMRTPLLAPLLGCRNCPWRRSCPQFNPESRAGCEARRQYLVQSRREVGSVEFNLMQRAVILREEVEAEAARIRMSGESPLQNRQWLRAYEVDLELAKELMRMKHGSKQTIVVKRADDDPQFIEVAGVEEKEL